MEIQIVSGFFGAGKTSFLNKYLPLLDGRTAVIQNEYGDIPLERDLLRENVRVRDLYAGCICCSLALDLRREIQELTEGYRPDRIIIEPSGVGKLSDVVGACMRTDIVKSIKGIVLVDLASFEGYAEDLGTFYLDQIQHAGLLLFSHLDRINGGKKRALIDKVRAYAPAALFYGDDPREMDSGRLLGLIRSSPDLKEDPQSPADGRWKTILNRGRVKNA